MRLLALAACASSLVVAGSALAHISVTPGLLVADDTQTLRLTVHNDLDQPMTGLAVTAPDGLRIVAARADDEEQWQDVVEDGAAVTWSGGPLAPNTGAAFALDVAVDAATRPGPVQLQAEQLYPGGGSLPWPISVTVVPAGTVTAEGSLDPLYIPGLVLIGLLVTTAVFFIAWLQRRRGRTLQER